MAKKSTDKATPAAPAKKGGTPAAAARPAQACPTDPKAALDPQKLLELMQKFGASAPAIFQLLTQLYAIWSSVGAGAAPVSCPNEHLHNCCQRAVDYQLKALAEQLHCCSCCNPEVPCDEEEEAAE